MRCTGCDEAVSGLCHEHGEAEAYAADVCARADGRAVLNLTQHATTSEQAAGGIVDPYDHDEVRDALTFAALPSMTTLEDRARMLAAIARERGYQRVMIGGAPFFMPVLERILIECDLWPCYAFSARESVDVTHADGTVRKTSVFRHVGLYDAGESPFAT